MATIQELLFYGKEQLERNGNEYAKYERKVLLEEVLDCSYMYMLLHGGEEVSSVKETEYRRLLERRCGHYPLQYLLGYAHFMDYTFYVNESVLIPRNDTEILVETASEVLKQVCRRREAEQNADALQGYHLLDLCCGSGCIGISLKLYHEAVELTLADISKEALAVTKKNMEKYQVEANVVCGNLFDQIEEKQDMIVCNPPYIEHSVLDTLMPEVKEHEPILALDGGENGTDFYERIIEEVPQYLNTGGWLLFEIGYDQAQTVSELMKQAGFLDIIVKRDYAGLDRVVYGHL